MMTSMPTSQQQPSGFTIVESLVAIVIVSVLMTAITPVIAISVANRVQARRVELATQAAKSYIDGIASRVIESPRHVVALDELDDNKNFISQRFTFVGVAPPATGGLTCQTTVVNSYCWNTLTSSLYCIDLDGNGCSSDSVQDMVIQAFRSATPSTTDLDGGYILGIRVYRADGFSDRTPLVKSDPETKRTQMTSTQGLGNLKAPLVEMSTEMAPDEATFRDFCDRLGCQSPQNTQ